VRRFLKSSALLLAAVAGWAAAGPGAEPPPRLDQGLFDQEVRLARASFDQGFFEFVALRLGRLNIDTKLDRADQADLLLAESLYLSGKREEAARLLAEFPRRHPASPLLLECRTWTGRSLIESEHRSKEAEEILRPLLAEIGGPAGRGLETAARTRLLRECRYFLCLALVERGETEYIEDLWDTKTDRWGKKTTTLVRAGALRLLDEQAEAPDGAHFVAEAHVLRARALCMLGRPDRCFDLLRTAFLEKPIGQTSPALRAQAFFWQAEARYGQARWEEAASLYGLSAEEAAAAGSAASAWRHRALYGRGWARHKHAQDLASRGLDGGRPLLEAAAADFAAVARGSAEHGDASLAAAARLRAGDDLVQMGRHAEAAAELAPLFGDQLRGTEARYLAALAAEGLGRLRRAEELLREATERHAGRNDALAMRIEMARGRVLFGLADWDGAIRSLIRAGEMSGPRTAQSYEAQLWIARAMAGQKRFAEAAAGIAPLITNRQAREALGQDRLSFHLGQVKLEQSKAKEGAAGTAPGHDPLEEAVRLFATTYQVSPLGELAIPAHLGAAEAHMLMTPPNPQEAFLQYAEVLKSPRATPEQMDLARLGTARALRSGRNFRKAADLLQREILDARTWTNAGTRLEAMRLRAALLDEGGEPDAAAEAYLLLAAELGSGPEAAGARLKHAEQLSRRGRHGEAAKALASLYGQCPPDIRPAVTFAAATAAESAGRPDQALKWYEAYVREGGPRDAEARLNAAHLNLSGGRAQEAVALAAQAFDQLSRETPRRHLLMARTKLAQARGLLALGRSEEAVGQFRRASDEAIASSGTAASDREAGGVQIDALMGLGQALLGAARRDDAAASFLRAAQLMREAQPAAAGQGAAPSTVADQALLQAARALQEAGHLKAAEQIRASVAAHAATPVAPTPESKR